MPIDLKHYRNPCYLCEWLFGLFWFALMASLFIWLANEVPQPDYFIGIVK